MANTILVKGDYVVAKKWNGEEIIGILDYTYTDGEHCVIDAKTKQRFCSHKNDVRLANEFEQNEIKKLTKEQKIITRQTENIIKNKQNNTDDELEAALAATD